MPLYEGLKQSLKKILFLYELHINSNYIYVYTVLSILLKGLLVLPCLTVKESCSILSFHTLILDMKKLSCEQKFIEFTQLTISKTSLNSGLTPETTILSTHKGCLYLYFPSSELLR